MRIGGDPVRTSREAVGGIMTTLAIDTTDDEVTLAPLLESMVLTLPAEQLEIHDGCVIVFDEEPLPGWASTVG